MLVYGKVVSVLYVNFYEQNSSELAYFPGKEVIEL